MTNHQYFPNSVEWIEGCNNPRHHPTCLTCHYSSVHGSLSIAEAVMCGATLLLQRLGFNRYVLVPSRLG